MNTLLKVGLCLSMLSPLYAKDIICTDGKWKQYSRGSEVVIIAEDDVYAIESVDATEMFCEYFNGAMSNQDLSRSNIQIVVVIEQDGEYSAYTANAHVE